MKNTKNTQSMQNMQNNKNISQKSEAKNAPEQRFSAGAVSATVWKNHTTTESGEQKEYRTISLQRSYLDKNNVWQHTNSLRVADLPKAALVLSKAYEHIIMKGGSLESSFAGNENVRQCGEC